MATNSQAAWDAGADLTANERPNGPQELSNPNATVPQWSYGYRQTIGGTGLTLYTNHFNDGGGYSGFDGWNHPGTVATAAVNAGTSPLVVNNGAGPLAPILPQEMVLHSGLNNTLSIVRWTAPLAGLYVIDAYWTDIDPYGGGGADGHIVVNGSSIYDAYWGNGGGAIAPTQLVSLNSGDVVDFALGPNGDYGFDSTTFNATIASTPEPSSIFTFLAASLPLVFIAKRVARTFAGV